MARKIYKFRIEPKINLPRQAHVVRVAMQASNPFLWAIFDEVEFPGTELREFVVVGTGQEIPDDLEYVGTYEDGAYIWHLCERHAADPLSVKPEGTETEVPTPNSQAGLEQSPPPPTPEAAPVQAPAEGNDE